MHGALAERRLQHVQARRLFLREFALRKQIAELARNARQLVETIGWQRIFS